MMFNIDYKGFRQMNVNQKIQFLKHRRHMDAMRIKRLKRRLDGEIGLNSLRKALDIADTVRNRGIVDGRVVEVNYYPLYQHIRNAYVFYSQNGEDAALKEIAVSIDLCNPNNLSKYDNRTNRNGLFVGERGEENLRKLQTIRELLRVAMKSIIVDRRKRMNYGNPRNPSNTEASPYKRINEYGGRNGQEINQRGYAEAIRACGFISHNLDVLYKRNLLKDNKIKDQLYKAVRDNNPEKGMRLVNELYVTMQALNSRMQNSAHHGKMEGNFRQTQAFMLEWEDRYEKIKNNLRIIATYLKSN